MQLKKSIAFFTLFFIAATSILAQPFTFNCTRDTFIARCAGTSCFTLKALIPDIHAASGTYTVNPIGATPSACFPVYVQPDDPGGTSADLTIDDIYSTPFNIGFPFPFYGTVYNNLIASPNGAVSFDVSKTGAFAHFGMLYDGTILNAALGSPVDLPSTLYDAALIMGPYHDMAPQYATSPNKKIQYQVVGTAPHRKWILSFYKMPLYLITGGCNLLIENTHQIVLYESTGIIEVLVFGTQPCLGWNDGRAMIGIQNAAKNQAVMVNGRRASDAPWGTPNMNEAYRFVPSQGASLFKRVELYDLTGTLITVGTTVNLEDGRLEASFPNICPTIGATTSYVVKSVYTKFDNPAVEIFGSDTINITKDASTNLNATAATTNTSCFSNTGTITITVPPAVATPPYTYILDGGTPVNGGSPFTFNNVTAGAHTVVVSDASGTCTSTLNVNVQRNNDITATIITTATACANVATGSITITPNNGTAPFSFQLDGFLPVTGPAPYTFSNLTAGNHNIVVYDATGCQTNVIVVDVPVGAGVSANSTSTASSCTMVANGSITTTALTGIAPFTWQLDGGAIVSGVNPHTFTGVSSGSHTVTIYDNVGCSRSYNVNVVAGPGVSGTASSTPATCAAIQNATLTLNAIAGAAPFSYQIDGGAFQTGTNPYTFSNLSAGPHTAIIRDNVGCTQTFNVTIGAGPGPLASAISSATSCNGAADGSILASGTGGVSPYSFSLDGATPVSGSSPYTFSNVNAGPHTITVTDAVGCVSNVFNIVVAVGPTITTTVNKTNVLCNGDATGAITVNQPALGNPPFQYSIGGVVWQPGNSFTGLAAGTYNVFYRSANGCSGSQLVNITQPTALLATTTIKAVRCFGENNGNITVAASGGSPPYQYSINGGINWQSSYQFNTAAGNYTITIKDANGCIITRNVVVTEPSLLTAFSLNANATCDGGNDGRITVLASGGNAGYRYSLDGINYQTSNVFNLPPGSFSVTVKDSLGCSMSFPATVGLTVNLFLNPLRDTSICEGTAGQLQINTNANVFSWSPSIGLNDTTVPRPIASPVATTQYVVKVTLGRCDDSDTMIVNVNKAPIPNAGPDGDICYGRSYTLQGSGGVQYNWSPPIYLNTTVGANPISTPTITTTYTVAVQDAIGCKSLGQDTVKVKVSQPLRVLTIPFDTIAYPGQQIQLIANSVGVVYNWSPASGLNNPFIQNPVATASNIIGGETLYKVVSTTADGCKGEGFVTIRISKGPDIYMPTAFTPNGDGLNEYFTPIPVGIKSYNYFKIFNRWGQLIFSTTRQNEGWDGRILGKEQPTGTYVWMIEGVAFDNRKITKKGIVTLIR